MRRAVLYARLPHAHDSAQRTLSLEDFLACLVQNVLGPVTEQLLGGGVPGTNLHFESYDKGRLRCSLQQLIYLTRKHALALHRGIEVATGQTRRERLQCLSKYFSPARCACGPRRKQISHTRFANTATSQRRCCAIAANTAHPPVTSTYSTP